MKHQLAIVETAQPSAEREILAAWQQCQQGEKLCLAFGQVCCEWRDKFRVKGFRGDAKGKGFVPILEQCGIPKSTAYWWMEKYEISAGLREAPLVPGKPTDCEVCGLHFRSVGKYERHRRKDHPDTPKETKPPKMLNADDRWRKLEGFVHNLYGDLDFEQRQLELYEHMQVVREGHFVPDNEKKLQAVLDSGVSTLSNGAICRDEPWKPPTYSLPAMKEGTEFTIQDKAYVLTDDVQLDDIGNVKSTKRDGIQRVTLLIRPKA